MKLDAKIACNQLPPPPFKNLVKGGLLGSAAHFCSSVSLPAHQGGGPSPGLMTETRGVQGARFQ